MQAKTERFEMRFDQFTIDRIDTWRGAQSDFPSRAEAVRRLVDDSLAPPSKNPTFWEKLNLFLLTDIMRSQKIKSDFNLDLIGEAVLSGNYWALQDRFVGLTAEPVERPLADEVIAILAMWNTVEASYKSLSKADKKIVGDAKVRFGSHGEFRGFDPHEGRHYSVASFLVSDFGLFERFKGRDLNTHFPVLEDYRRMLSVFEPLREQLVGRQMTGKEIVSVLKAAQRENALVEKHV